MEGSPATIMTTNTLPCILHAYLRAATGILNVVEDDNFSSAEDPAEQLIAFHGQGGVNTIYDLNLKGWGEYPN
jgi:hypothetical protein